MNLSVEKFRRNTSDPKALGNSSGKEDSGTKLMGDDETQSNGEENNGAKSSPEETFFHFEGVRFTPRVIEFVDAFEGKQFAVKIKIQNVGKNPVSVRIGEPNSFVFQMKKSSRRTRLLAAGGSITRTITYSYHNDDLVQRSQIPVQINGRLVDYPIVVKRAVPKIEVEPPKLDFKVLNLGASAKSLMLAIHNMGGKRTRFEIDVGKNDLDLVVTPVRGTIKAKDQTNVVVEMMGLREGEYYKELWITTDEKPIRVPVLVEVVRPRLEILHPYGTEDFTLVNFRPTFNGTQRATSIVLKNFSAEATLFITLAEMDGDLQFLKDARKVHEPFSMFTLTAEEGRLEPFESRILTVLFQPKTTSKKKNWRRYENDERKESQWEHIVFFRINRVHCIERKELANVESNKSPKMMRERSTSILQSFTSLPISEDHTKTTKSSGFISEFIEEDSMDKFNSYVPETTPGDERILRLCLQGKAVEPDVSTEPSKLEFGSMDVGQSLNKVLKLTNKSMIPVKFKLWKIMNVRITPDEGWIEPEKAIEILVRLTPTCAGEFNKKIKLEMFGRSDVVFEKDRSLITIAVIFVPYVYTANIVPKPVAPRIGLGITPLVADEVGLLKELMTFASPYEKPRATLLFSFKENSSPNWMRNERDRLNNLDNAMIAFPNDRPRLYYAWPKEKICRTIFTGFFRYAPPLDESYTLSSKEAESKRRHYAFWTDYLKMLTKLRELNYPRLEELKNCLSEYDVSCGKHYNMGYYKPNLNFVSKTENREGFKKFFRKVEVQPRQALVPLSPMFLSNINVKPKFINFSTVASNTLVHENLTIDNMNPFAISIRFVPGKSAVSVLEGDTIIILPMTTKSLQISFQTKDLGRYYGFLNYVINGSHEFKITISAFVTSKTLILEDKDLVMEFGNYSQKSAFQPRSKFLTLGNLLQSPIKYRWEMPPDSPFVTEIIEGEVPSRTKLLTEITFALNPRKTFYTELSLVSESGGVEMIKLIHPNKKVHVDFLTNRIDLADIPLNLPTKAKAIIQNACYHDVVFELTSRTPMPGVVVEPKEGVIKARSFFPLDVKIQIPVVMRFSFDVVVYVHSENRISVKITGNVVIPLIRIKPSEIMMRRICAQSYDVVTMCVENAGTTPAEIFIDFKSCPEYKVVGEKSKLYIQPKKSSEFVIHFQPKDVVRYVFYLPVIINRILGPPMMQEPKTENLSFYLSASESNYRDYGEVFRSQNYPIKIPCVCINSIVSPNLLKISSLSVNFRPMPHTHSEFETQTIVISNDYFDDVTFCIRNDDLGESNNSPFLLLPTDETLVEYRSKSMKAQLNRGKKLAFEAKFRPKTPGIFTAEIPIFVRGYSNGYVYNYIKLRGELKKPKLYTECPEIHFPPLPLDVGCDALISVHAENYLSADTMSCIVWNFPEDEKATQEPLTVTWLTEPNILQCSGAQIFQVLIKFRSSVPTALRGYLVFVDSNGTYCTVLVTAIADNSAVTTHAFLTTRSFKYRLVRDVTPISQIRTEKETSSHLIHKPELKNQGKQVKKGRSKSNSSLHSEGCANDPQTPAQVYPVLPIENGPRLVIQMSKSMNRPTQLSFVNVAKTLQDNKNKGSSSTVLVNNKSRVLNSFSYPIISQSDSYLIARTLSYGPQFKVPDLINDVTHPNFPVMETFYGKHFQETLNYVERWMYEVVMRCDQYLSIPRTFQRLKTSAKVERGVSGRSKTSRGRAGEKDFIDFLEEILTPDLKSLIPDRFYPDDKNRSFERAEKLQFFFSDILKFLNNNRCLLPHVKPEYLLDYEDYLLYVKSHEPAETFKWRNSEHDKINTLKILNDFPKIKEEGLKQASSILSGGESWKKTLFEGFNLESEMDVIKPEVEESENPIWIRPVENVGHLVGGKYFTHDYEIFDKVNYEARSTQAWLDIVIQIFRTFILTRIIQKNTIPQVQVFEMNDRMQAENVCLTSYCSQYKSKITDTEPRSHEPSLQSNLYTVQERILLTWLNRHFEYQKNLLWNASNNGPDSFPNPKIINNFDKDLSDSLALIAVTAAHCPYLINEFSDVFPRPDTPNKMYHNAGKLVLVWRTLNVGLTVETVDIVKPNPVFMIMLVAHLYEILPYLHPRSLICFSAPLSSELTRSIQIKNETSRKALFQPKFLGEHEGLFRLSDSSSFIEVKASDVTEISITFTARKIKKVSATLILSGLVVSPNFARHLAFYLQGEPSELLEVNKFSFCAPLYKVICTHIPVKPPYVESTTYEVWYTTRKPEYKEHSDISRTVKPWLKIRSRKLSRRLFVNKSEIQFLSSEKSTSLSVTIACLTEEDRQFWLLFRSSKIGDFIILIEIKTKPRSSYSSVEARFAETWTPSSECLCPDGGKTIKLSYANPTNCPYLTNLGIPVRNNGLWEALRTMFLKTLRSEEKSFWSEHFELNIGLCLILWLLSPEEEEAVIDEFVHILKTRVTYQLKIEPPNDKFVTIPEKIEIADVRENSQIRLPIHISKGAPPKLKFILTMTSENKKEVRNLKVLIFAPTSQDGFKKRISVVGDESRLFKPICEPMKIESRKPCRLEPNKKIKTQK